jgi:photosystem II stability/assembly factor-like uncharacterized protein
MIRPSLATLVVTFVGLCGFAAQAPAAVTPAVEKPKSEFGALKFRALGPAISGRVTRVAGVPGDPLAYFVAFAQGGVWKSVNGGRDWQPLFDEQPTNSIGSIAVAPSDPNVVYVGSGEANIRGNVALGSGIFKSIDGGKNWQQVWKGRGQIGTMVVHPKNPDIAFVAVFGSPFGPSQERGVYRTTDGGKSWQQVLFRDERTGASDVTFDPGNPRILFAGMWQALRQPWNATSGGPGSGLYRSADGGDTWQPMKEHGLPAGDWGKVGVRVAPSDSHIIYALIEAKDGGLFRSEDGGEKWEHVSAARVIRQRAWYYSCLTIDPTNPNVVWVPQVNLVRTIDAGKSWQAVKIPGHGDHHDVWIDPANPRRIITGNDGGVSLTLDGGATWAAPAIPTPQFYNIDVDDRLPYHVGGTIQDWGTASGPASTLRSGEDGGGGPNLGDFYIVGGGEAGDFVYDRAAPGHIYAGEYSGYISHYQEGTGNFRNISIYPKYFSGWPAKESKYRFQWTAPIAASPHDPHVLYHGANVLLRTIDRGVHWETISPDLTRNDKSKQQWSGGPITGDITGVEVYDTIFSIAESPAAAGEIWVGTDDGLVQLTRDGGKSWSNVTPPKLPEWGTVEAIEPSRRDAGTVYVAVDARRLDDSRPYLFRSRDFGKHWEQLGNGLPPDQHLFVVREDPTDPNLLYVGSERGVYFSRDGGGNFRDLRNNLPAVNVADIEVKHDDLILGTRRGIWILDDITALRAFTPEIKARPAHLFTPRAAYRFRLDARWDQNHEGQQENAPQGMTITYWLKEKPKGPPPGHKPVPEDPNELKLEIFDRAGKLVRTLSSVAKPNRYPKDDPDEPKKEAEPGLTKDQGLNRMQWDLRYEGSKRLPQAKIDSGNPDDGPMALPGKYTLKFTVDGQAYTSAAEILADPHSPVPPGELRQNFEFALQARAALDRLVDDIEEVRAIYAQTDDINKRTAANPAAKELQVAAAAVLTRCDELEHRMHNPEAEVAYDVLAGRQGGAKLYSQIAPLFTDIQNSDYAPTQGQLSQMEENLADLTAVETELGALRNGDLARLEAQAKALALPRVILPRAE